jgi:hypothetical protein
MPRRYIWEALSKQFESANFECDNLSLNISRGREPNRRAQFCHRDNLARRYWALGLLRACTPRQVFGPQWWPCVAQDLLRLVLGD